jgi:hypothetical protein
VRTNKPGTCLWCGKRVRTEPKYELFGPKPVVVGRKGVHGGFFHSGACAEAFGIRMAQLGHRFVAEASAPEQIREEARA